MDFTTWLIGQGVTPSTARRYAKDAARFLKMNLPFPEFVVRMKSNNCTNNTVNAYVKALRHYGMFIDNDELKRLKYLPKNACNVSTLTDDEIRRFLSITPPHKCNKRETRIHETVTVFFSIMAYTGMRPVEIRNLTVSDIDFRSQHIRIVATKTQTIRTIPLPVPLRDLLLNHVQSLDREKLFTGLCNQSLYYHFHKRLERLGITRKNLHVYSLRHSYATRMVDAEADPFSVKTLLGHKDLTMTERYYHLSAKRLQKVSMKDPLAVAELDTKTRLRAIKEAVEALDLTGLLQDIRLSDDKLMITIRGSPKSGSASTPSRKNS